MRFSASTVISLTLIAASAPAHSAPIALESRGLGSIISGLVSAGLGPLEPIIENILPKLGARSIGADVGEIGAGLLGGIQDILGTIFRQDSEVFRGQLFTDPVRFYSRRSFADLSDDQVNTFLEWVNKQDSPKSSKRNVEARSVLTKILGDAVTALTPDALRGLEKLLGGSSESATSSAPAAATSAPASRRSLSLETRGLGSIISGLVGAGLGPLEPIIENFLPKLGARSIGADLGEIGTGVLGGIQDILGTIFRQESEITRRRSFADLSDDQVNTFLEWVNKQDSPKSSKRDLEARARKIDVIGLLGKAAEALTPAAVSGLKKLLEGSDSDTSSATSSAPAEATSAPASARSLNELD
ncbi:hypothetical protein B0H15DRAFT_949697 [Mycena belliarum]|uniref:DUF937 domain-containing protein n=1 Tax=Mycena belliarum TaxID=1033014 RepID=A0AAD6U8I6_9AGAR|nr:hypothetical protein B0H15DRAFT_949697 [Mycena belliae]